MMSNRNIPMVTVAFSLLISTPVSQTTGMANAAERVGSFNVVREKIGSYNDILIRPDGNRARWSSRDGRHLGYVAGRLNRSGELKYVRVVVDGKEGPKIDFTEPAGFFSPDGLRHAYIAYCGEKSRVVIDEVDGPEYDGIGTTKGVVFSPNGQRVAYTARRGKDWFVVVDGKEGPRYPGVGGLSFSSDGRRLAYLVTAGGTFRMCIDGQLGDRFSQVGGEVVFSPDNKRFAYMAGDDSGWWVVLDHKTQPKYPSVLEGDVVFSDDSQHYAYGVIEKDHSFVVVDGVPGPEFKGIEGLVFSPAGSRYAYCVKTGRGESRVIVDGELGAEYENLVPREMTIIEKQVYRQIMVDFSPDGKHFAYMAVKGGEVFMVIDGQQTKKFDLVSEGAPLFDSLGNLEFIAIKGKDLFRVTCTLVPEAVK